MWRAFILLIPMILKGQAPVPVSGYCRILDRISPAIDRPMTVLPQPEAKPTRHYNCVVTFKPAMPKGSKLTLVLKDGSILTATVEGLSAAVAPDDRSPAVVSVSANGATIEITGYR